MLRAVATEELVLRRLANPFGRERADDTRDVQEMTKSDIVRRAVAAPRAAAHRQRERQCIVEAAARCEAMRLVDDHPRNRQRQPERGSAIGCARVEADRMDGTL